MREFNEELYKILDSLDDDVDEGIIQSYDYEVNSRENFVDIQIRPVCVAERIKISFKVTGDEATIEEVEDPMQYYRIRNEYYKVSDGVNQKVEYSYPKTKRTAVKWLLDADVKDGQSTTLEVFKTDDFSVRPEALYEYKYRGNPVTSFYPDFNFGNCFPTGQCMELNAILKELRDENK